MATRYIRGDNDLLDISLMAITTMGGKLSQKEIKRFIREQSRNIIYFDLEDKKTINYFDFDIKIDKFGDSLEIKANNIVTALWFIGEFPYEPDFIMKKKVYLTDYGFYKYDGRTKKLTFHEKT